MQNHFAQMCYHVCVLSSIDDLEDLLEFLTKYQEKHHVAFTKFSILTSFSILCQNDESKLLYGVEFWSTQWILTPSFLIPSSLIRSPFQGVHTIFCYKIMMDLGQREPCFNKSMAHLLQNPSVNATTRPCRIGGRSLSALKISCHGKSIR